MKARTCFRPPWNLGCGLFCSTVGSFLIAALLLAVVFGSSFKLTLGVSLLTAGAFFIYSWSFLLTIEADFCLGWESASNEHPNGL